MLADAKNRQAMSKRNIERASLYGAARMVDAYEKLYREISAQV